MESKKIAVLLSSYNGEQFIKEQIDSVLNQKECKVSLLVRDDGSTDNTIKILENYVNKGNLNYYCGKNLKPAKSFLDLVKHSPECEFYAFCDQDDVWEEDKLISAINQIGDTSTPTCYHSAYMMVDKDLNEIGIGGNDYVSDTIYKSIIRNII